MRLRCNHTYQTSKRSVSKKDIFVVSYEIKTKQLGKPDKKLQNKTGILLEKLFWPTVRKNCSSDREKLLKFAAEGREFAKFLRSLEQFIQTVKGQNNFW